MCVCISPALKLCLAHRSVVSECEIEDVAQEDRAEGIEGQTLCPRDFRIVCDIPRCLELFICVASRS